MKTAHVGNPVLVPDLLDDPDTAWSAAAGVNGLRHNGTTGEGSLP